MGGCKSYFMGCLLLTKNLDTNPYITFNSATNWFKCFLCSNFHYFDVVIQLFRLGNIANRLPSKMKLSQRDPKILNYFFTESLRMPITR